MNNTRWILAFDSSCGRCRRISDAVAEVAQGRLEVLPLTNAEVSQWRRQILGPDPEWAPTLLRVDAAGVPRLWMGRSMSVPMVRLLGPRATGRLLRILGELRAADYGQAPAEGVGRRQLFHIGAGAAVVGAMMLGGRLEAKANPAETWVRANLGRLPQTYDEIVAHSVEYRRAIYVRLSPAIQSTMWTEQLTRYRDARPDMSAAQHEAIVSALAVTSNPATFEPANLSTVPPDIDRLRAAMSSAFGHEETRRLIARLGPDDLTFVDSNCSCHTTSDCSAGYECAQDNTCPGGLRGRGCGDLGLYACSGDCNSSTDS